MLSDCFLHAFELWLNDLQRSQNTLSLQLYLTYPRSPHLKHYGPPLFSVVAVLVVLCVAVPNVVPVLALCLHGVLRLVGLVVPVVV